MAQPGYITVPGGTHPDASTFGFQIGNPGSAGYIEYSNNIAYNIDDPSSLTFSGWFYLTQTAGKHNLRFFSTQWAEDASGSWYGFRIYTEDSSVDYKTAFIFKSYYGSSADNNNTWTVNVLDSWMTMHTWHHVFWKPRSQDFVFDDSSSVPDKVEDWNYDGISRSDSYKCIVGGQYASGSSTPVGSTYGNVYANIWIDNQAVSDRRRLITSSKTPEGIQKKATITNITQADPMVVTTAEAHGFTTGDVIFINGVSGMVNTAQDLNSDGLVTTSNEVPTINHYQLERQTFTFQSSKTVEEGEIITQATTGATAVVLPAGTVDGGTFTGTTCVMYQLSGYAENNGWPGDWKDYTTDGVTYALTGSKAGALGYLVSKGTLPTAIDPHAYEYHVQDWPHYPGGAWSGVRFNGSITVLSSTTFSVNTDTSSGFTAYSSGGEVRTLAVPTYESGTQFDRLPSVYITGDNATVGGSHYDGQGETNVMHTTTRTNVYDGAPKEIGVE